MARLRYNGLTATLGAALTSTGTTITFAAALTHSGGTAVPTIAGTDYIPLTILTSTGAVSEIVSLTAYTSGATTGTITRAQESTTGVAHASGDAVVHSATVLDFASSGTGDASWTTVSSLSGSWVQDTTGSTVGYRKDASGFVHLRGKIKSGTIGSTAFTLPTGYRPVGTHLRPAIAGSTTVLGVLALYDTGAVQPYAGNNSYFYLEGITFYGV